jgi:DNA-binding response OmpR family regulator
MASRPLPSSNVVPDSGPRRLLIVDDDRKLCRLLTDYLEPLGYQVTSVHTGPEGVDHAISGSWHAVILDMMLPGLDGLQVLQKIRATSDVPVLMLTARGEEADRIVGLEFGADDYLPKTFSTRELLARLRAVTRRLYRAPGVEPLGKPDIVIGELRIISEARTATLADQTLYLTPVEFDLLVCLARSAGRVKSRDQLLEEIRERDYEVFDRSIDVHISALRKKLGDDAKSPHYIRTFRSAGYMLIHPESA